MTAHQPARPKPQRRNSKLAGEVIRLRAGGATVDRITDTLNLARANVRAILTAAGLPVRANNPRVEVTPALIERAVRAYRDEGASFYHVMHNILHKHRNPARKILEDAGVVVRAQGVHANREEPTPPPFSSREAALCRAVLGNGISLQGAMKLYGNGLSEDAARTLICRYEKEAIM